MYVWEGWCQRRRDTERGSRVVGAGLAARLLLAGAGCVAFRVVSQNRSVQHWSSVARNAIFLATRRAKPSLLLLRMMGEGFSRTVRTFFVADDGRGLMGCAGLGGGADISERKREDPYCAELEWLDPMGSSETIYWRIKCPFLMLGDPPASSQSFNLLSPSLLPGCYPSAPLNVPRRTALSFLILFLGSTSSFWGVRCHHGASRTGPHPCPSRFARAPVRAMLHTRSEGKGEGR